MSRWIPVRGGNALDYPDWGSIVGLDEPLAVSLDVVPVPEVRLRTSTPAAAALDFEHQPVRVAEGDRVAVAVGVAVPLLWVGEVHDGVDGDEPAQRWVVFAGAEVSEASVVFGERNVDLC